MILQLVPKLLILELSVSKINWILFKSPKWHPNLKYGGEEN